MRLLYLMLMGGLLVSAETAGRAEYIGGTLDKFKAGAAGEIHASHPKWMVFATRSGQIGVPYEKINLIEYGQNVSRRIVLAAVISPVFLLSKSRKHFLTVGYQDESGQQQAVVLRVEKSKVRVLLASLEARTGLKITYQDDEARKAGKG